jgi:hypothetical protein
MTKIVLRTRTNEPDDLEKPVFCLSCRNRCLVVADHFGERVTEEEKISRKDAKVRKRGYNVVECNFATTIEGSDDISGGQDRKKIISERLVFNVRSYQSRLVLSPLLFLKGFR